MTKTWKTLTSYILIVLLIFSFFANGSVTYATTSTADQVIEKANELLGVPYRYGGTSPKGFDCSGFLYYVFDQVGVTLTRTTVSQYKEGTSVERNDLKIGDLVFFQTVRSGVSHSGIYVGDDQFIHASSSKGIAIDSLNDPHYWSKRYIGARRVLEEEYETLPTGEFHDVGEEHWAYKEIKFLTENGISNGFENSFYNPSDSVTRVSAATMLINALGLKTTHSRSQFKDISNDHWGFQAIHAVSEAGFFNADANGNFNPNETLTRAQVAAVFTRAFDLKATGKPLSFSDVNNKHWAFQSIQAVASNGLASGNADGTFQPNQEINRASFSVILYRALHLK